MIRYHSCGWVINWEKIVQSLLFQFSFCFLWKQSFASKRKIDYCELRHVWTQHLLLFIQIDRHPAYPHAIFYIRIVKWELLQFFPSSSMNFIMDCVVVLYSNTFTLFHKRSFEKYFVWQQMWKKFSAIITMYLITGCQIITMHSVHFFESGAKDN